ncbi:cytochrome c biogenesis protein CcdC [Paenibacillus kobensis]|uniref:cytochrome c biogenesis protein CcdC n=1 Tax=Paenibacillus kobensis TaxID=59841 RepID=UPI000FDAAE44|nr:cytochrome c biogenesis protein CcdC [Paenibacillus kobensis]
MASGEFITLVIVIAALVLFRTMRSVHRPIRGSGIRLLLPIIYMLPGAYLIMNPKAHAPSYEWLAAIGIGILLSIPLIWTTNYEVREDKQVYAQRNRGFIIAFLAVLAIRFLMRAYISDIDPDTLAALFITVAFSYALTWRIVSFLKFRKVARLRGV